MILFFLVLIEGKVATMKPHHVLSKQLLPELRQFIDRFFIKYGTNPVPSKKKKREKGVSVKRRVNFFTLLSVFFLKAERKEKKIILLSHYVNCHTYGNGFGVVR